MEQTRATERELMTRIHELESQVKALARANQDAHDMNEVLVAYFRKLERKYNRSVKRELSYREMLFVFNHRQAEDLVMDFISERGLRVQFGNKHNFRCN